MAGEWTELVGVVLKWGLVSLQHSKAKPCAIQVEAADIHILVHRLLCDHVLKRGSHSNRGLVVLNTISAVGEVGTACGSLQQAGTKILIRTLTINTSRYCG